MKNTLLPPRIGGSVLMLLLALAGCGGNPWLKPVKEQIASGQRETAVMALKTLSQQHPEDGETRALYHRQRDLFISQTLIMGDVARSQGQMEDAGKAYEKVLALEPGNARALAGQNLVAAGKRQDEIMQKAAQVFKAGDLAAAEALLRGILAENPDHVGARNLLRHVRAGAAQTESQAQAVKGPFAKPISLEFRDASLKSVFEVIARTAGINFVFDKDLRGDTPVTIFVKNTSIDEVMRLILVTNQLERKVLNENSVLIYPNTPAKLKDYQELEVRSFYLSNADVKQAMNLIKSVVKTRDVFIDEKLNLLVMRDTPEAIRLAERLMERLDLAEPEVMLEVEVLEVARSKLLNLGVQFPDLIGYGRLTPDTTSSTTTTTATTTSTTLGGALASGYTNLRTSLGVPYVANPAFVLNLHDENGDSNVLANPRIRVRNKEKAKIHIGDKLPVFTTTSTANVGVSASVNYLDVGLKLEVEPQVYLDDEVAIKVGLEVSSVSKEVTGPQSSLAYQVGTRTTNTVLRLKNGETQVLAGLISEQERNSSLRLPGLGDIPVVGRLFSSDKDSSSRTEIVLLITPRVVRNLTRPELALAGFPGGTDSAVGMPPLKIKATPAGALSLSSGGRVTSMAGPVPFVAPEGLPPGGPTAEGGPAPGEGSGQVMLMAPPQAQAGQSFSVAVVAQGVDGSQGGIAEVVYDPAFLDATGGANGRVPVSLAPGGDGSLRGEIQFRVKAAANADALFQLAAIRVNTANGAAVTLPPGSPQIVKLVP